jgi:hypothetical protein
MPLEVVTRDSQCFEIAQDWGRSAGVGFRQVRGPVRSDLIGLPDAKTEPQ